MLVGNPMWMRGRTDNYQSLTSPSGALFFSQTGPIQDGWEITFTFNGETYTLVFKNTPDVNNPYEVPIGSYTDMATHIAGLRYIAEHYAVTTGGLDFIFTAKEIDRKWDLTIVSSNFAYSLTDAVYVEPKKSFKGYLELFKQDEYDAPRDESQPMGVLDADPHREELELFSFDPLEVNEDNLDWEVQELIYPYFDPQKPRLDGIPIVHGVYVHFWMKYWESYGTPPVAGFMKTEGGQYNYYGALLGRVPHHEWEPQEFVDTYFDINKKWLTNAPDCKMIGMESNEWLSAYYDEAADHFLKVTAYMQDGSTEVYNTTNLLDGAAKPHNVAVFGTGPAQIGLKDEISDYTLICKYDVQLMTGTDTAQTEKYTYCIDHKCHLNECELVFLGALGNWDTARFVGTIDQGYESDSVSAVKSRTPWNTKEHRYLKAKTKRDRVYNFKTGYKRDEEAQWLNELAISECVCLLKDGVFTPIVIEDKGGASFGNRAADVFSGGFTGRIADIV